jgi:hypothetical protein
MPTPRKDGTFEADQIAAEEQSLLDEERKLKQVIEVECLNSNSGQKSLSGSSKRFPLRNQHTDIQSIAKTVSQSPIRVKQRGS